MFFRSRTTGSIASPCHGRQNRRYDFCDCHGCCTDPQLYHGSPCIFTDVIEFDIHKRRFSTISSFWRPCFVFLLCTIKPCQYLWMLSTSIWLHINHLADSRYQHSISLHTEFNDLSLISPDRNPSCTLCAPPAFHYYFSITARRQRNWVLHFMYPEQGHSNCYIQ